MCIVQLGDLENLAITKRTMISNLIEHNLFFLYIYIETTFAWSNIKRFYMFFKLFFLMFLCYFPIQSSQKHIFSYGPFTSDFADTISITAKTTIYSVIEKLNHS